MLSQYNNEDIQISITPDTVTIFFKKTGELRICQNMYVIRLEKGQVPIEVKP